MNAGRIAGSDLTRDEIEGLHETFLLTSKERDAIGQMAAELDISRSGVMRQALRHYQILHERLKAGETFHFSGDAQRMAETWMPALSPRSMSDEEYQRTLTALPRFAQTLMEDNMNDSRMTLAECPPGLFLYKGSYGFKTEYGATIKGEVTHWPDAYCVETGECFWGGCKTHEDRAKLLVEPIELTGTAFPFKILSRDDARLRLSQAIANIRIGNPTDDKLILDELAELGCWIAALPAKPTKQFIKAMEAGDHGS